MKAVSQTYRWPFETAGRAVSREEVDAAWTAYRTRPTAEARDVIVERYIHLVRYMARRLGRALPPSVDADDLVGAGIEGFLGAVERFDPDQGTDFSVYALTRIRGAMVDFVREIDPVGRTTRRRLREAGRAVAALRQLRVIARAAKDARIDVSPTYLALHALPAHHAADRKAFLLAATKTIAARPRRVAWPTGRKGMLWARFSNLSAPTRSPRSSAGCRGASSSCSSSTTSRISTSGRSP